LNLKTQTKSAVSVREGQGVVLLCGTPSYAGGKAFIVLLIRDSYTVAYLCSMGFNVFWMGRACTLWHTLSLCSLEMFTNSQDFN